MTNTTPFHLHKVSIIGQLVEVENMIWAGDGVNGKLFNDCESHLYEMSKF